MTEKNCCLDPPPTVMPLEKLMPAVMLRFGGDTYKIREGMAAAVGVVEDAPKPYVVKTLKPGLRAIEKKYRLLEEFDVLFRCANDAQEPAPLHIPEAMDYDTRPLHLVMSHLQGQGRNYKQLQAMSAEKRHEAGRRLGRTMAWTNLALPLDIFMEQRMRESPDPLNFKWSYDAFFSEHVKGFEHAAYPVLSYAAQVAWAGLCYYYPNGADRHGQRVNHSALIPENLLWKDDELVGVIDWDDARPGDINQELRGALEMGPEVLDGAVEELDNRNVHTDRKHIILWGLARNVGILSYWINKNSTNNHHFYGAAARIQRLLPDENWLELQDTNRV